MSLGKGPSLMEKRERRSSLSSNSFLISPRNCIACEKVSETIRTYLASLKRTEARVLAWVTAVLLAC